MTNERKGSGMRTIVMRLDPRQYLLDNGAETPPYNDLTYVVRRPSNNPMLVPHLQSLLNCSIPEWFRPILLGFGDPSAVVPSIGAVDLADSFVDDSHFRECGGDSISGKGDFWLLKDDQTALKYDKPVEGPYPQDFRKKNQIRFTSTQSNLIVSV